MFICLDCGHIFGDFDEREGAHELGIHWVGCPVCGGKCAETTKCDWCGEYITGNYVELADGTILCSDCYTEKDIADIF